MIHFISPAYKTYPILIPSLLLQSSPRWDLQIVHDGPSPPFEAVVKNYNDERVIGATTQHTGVFGHCIRAMLLENIKCDPDDYISHQNHDNYCFPNMVAAIEQCTEDMVIWNCAAHNYYGYQALNSKLEYGHIDMGCVAVKAKIAKKIGWKSVMQDSDWLMIQECWKQSFTYNILPQSLFVHN